MYTKRLSDLDLHLSRFSLVHYTAAQKMEDNKARHTASDPLIVTTRSIKDHALLLPRLTSAPTLQPHYPTSTRPVREAPLIPLLPF